MSTTYHPDIPSNISAGRDISEDRPFGFALNVAAARINSRLITAYKRWAQRRIDRQAFSHLLALDEHILSDIGVSREDVIWATRLPSKVNASRELEKVSQYNRSRFW